MNSENSETAPASAAAEQPRATRKPARAPRRASVAPKKGNAGKKAPAAKNANAARRKVNTRKGAKEARKGTKTEAILKLLSQPGGVTGKELIKATGWQPHSVRGFLSGTVGKKMGLTVVSSQGEDGERSYAVNG